MEQKKRKRINQSTSADKVWAAPGTAESMDKKEQKKSGNGKDKLNNSGSNSDERNKED